MGLDRERGPGMEKTGWRLSPIALLGGGGLKKALKKALPLISPFADSSRHPSQGIRKTKICWDLFYKKNKLFEVCLFTGIVFSLGARGENGNREIRVDNRNNS